MRGGPAVCVAWRAASGASGVWARTTRFTGDLSQLGGSDYVLERTLRDSKIVERGHHHGMKMYLGFDFVNLNNPATPLVEWFDDAGWNRTVTPAVHDAAAAARALGFDGLAFDQELYPQRGGQQTASWQWNYPGNQHSEAETREKVRARGQDLMRAILSAYPDVDILAYFQNFPDTWDEVVQENVNHVRNAFHGSVQLDLWNGLTEVEGYHRITFLNSTFYKTFHVGKLGQRLHLRVQLVVRAAVPPIRELVICLESRAGNAICVD